MMRDWYGGGGWGPGEWFAMALMMVVFWGAVAAVVVLVVRSSRHHDGEVSPGTGSSGGEALRILDERFARGELDADEYTRRRELLRPR